MLAITTEEQRVSRANQQPEILSPCKEMSGLLRETQEQFQQTRKGISAREQPKLPHQSS
jgi:hypothetical protein